MSSHEEVRLPVRCSSAKPTVVVIAPNDVPVQVRAANAPVLRFETSEEFEQWSHGSAACVAAAVYAALAELDIDLKACAPRTQEVVMRLCGRPMIPSVKEMFSTGSSRRSYYRSWSEDIPETPAEFLTRVRLLRLRTAAADDLSARRTNATDLR